MLLHFCNPQALIDDPNPQQGAHRKTHSSALSQSGKHHHVYIDWIIRHFVMDGGTLE